MVFLGFGHRPRTHLALLKAIFAFAILTYGYHLHWEHGSTIDRETPSTLREDDQETAPLLRETILLHDKQLSLVYRLMLHNDTVRSQSKHERCEEYFTELYQANPQWLFDTFEDDNGYESDLSALNRKTFVQSLQETYQKETYRALHTLPGTGGKGNEWRRVEVPSAKLAEFEAACDKAVRALRSTEQHIRDATTNLRVFSSCYLEPLKGEDLNLKALEQKYQARTTQGTASTASDLTCYGLLARLFPFFTGQYPVFTRWDGSVVEGELPVMAKYDKAPEQKTTPHSKAHRTPLAATMGARLRTAGITADCFVMDYLHQLNGRGIVMSVSDNQVDEAVNLVRVLRGLGNTLPLQIFHKGDLSPASITQLTHAARLPLDEDTSESFGPTSQRYGLGEHPPKPRMQANTVQTVKALAFPPQDVWFVNVQRCIKAEYNLYFDWVYNKFFPYMFGSFDETILMDSDVVPFVKPNSLFQTTTFEKTGTLFFRDRTIAWNHPKNYIAFFKNMLPTAIDEMLFGIPQATNHTTLIDYLDPKWRRDYYMEAGVVVYRRSQHYAGCLMALTMNHWTKARSKLWGDKEMFWLGLSLVGDENYGFNGNTAASIGRVTPPAFRPAGVISKEVCSIQPAHISSDDNQTLLWMNSGFRFCKKPGTFDSFKESKYAQMYTGADRQDNLTPATESSLKQMYYEAIEIEAAIIPPLSQFPKRAPDEPEQGWHWPNKQVCGGYLWCAYTNIGGSTQPEHRGKLITFSEQERLRFRYLGDLWTGYKILQPGIPRRTIPT